MYLSAELMAVANQAVQETLEQTSIAWQAIPHWDTGDPGQARVRKDLMYNSADGTGAAPLGADSLELEPKAFRFYVTLAQACASTPDALLAAVMSRTVKLAATVDDSVVGKLHYDAKPYPEEFDQTVKIEDILNYLIDARVKVENAGYRAPSCLLTNTAGVKALSRLVGGVPVTESLLDAANINSLHRAPILDKPRGATEATQPDTNIRFLVLGRRQRIAHGCAAAASPGEEPVDLAVSVPPSLEVVGETASGTIELAVRIRFATRIKDERGVVGVVVPQP
jgi:hypothetical protein